MHVWAGNQTQAVALPSLPYSFQEQNIVLVSTDVYADDNVISIAVLDHPYTRDGVEVLLRIRDTGVSLLPSSWVPCVVSDRICSIRLQIAAAVFVSGIPDSGLLVEVLTRLNRTDSTRHVLGVVTVHPAQSAALANVFTAHVPARAVHLGDTFTVSIFSTFTHLLQTFTLDLGTNTALRMTHFDLVHEGWSGTTASTGTRATLAYFRRTDGLDTGVQATPELIARVTVRVQASQGVGELTLRWNESSDVHGNAVVSNVTGVVVGRAVHVDVAGSIYIESEQVRGILIAGEHKHVLNTAALDGVAVRSNLSVFGLLDTGAIRLLPSSELQCTTSHVALSCSSSDALVLRAMSSPSGGAVAVTVRHLATGVTNNRSYTLLNPTLPVNVVLQRSVLRNIRTEAMTAGCTADALYQSTTLHARTMFTGDPSGAEFMVDVTPYIQPLLRVGSTDVAFLSTSSVGSVTIVGRSAGQSVITATNPTTGRVVASAEVIVDSANPIAVVDLRVALIKGFSVAVRRVDSTFFSATEIRVEADLSPLTYEGETALILAEAVFEDDSVMLVDSAAGLIVETTNSSEGVIVPVDNSSIQVGSSTGMVLTSPVLHVSWVGTAAVASRAECARLAMIDTNVHVHLDLPRATAVIVEAVGQGTSGARITHGSDVASSAGVPVFVDLRVRLVYPDRTIDATMDARTVVTAASTALVRVEHSSTRLRVTCIVGQVAETFSLNVTFTHEGVVAAYPITIVKTTQALTSLLPDGGSTTPTVANGTILSPIFGTAPTVYEGASLGMVLALSNGERIAVPTSQLVFTVRDAAGGADTLVGTTRLQPSQAMALHVRGTFRGVVSNTMAITVAATPVYAQQIRRFQHHFNSQRLQLSPGFRGAAGAGPAVPTVELVLSNSRYALLLCATASPAGVPCFPLQGFSPREHTFPTRPGTLCFDGRVMYSPDRFSVSMCLCIRVCTDAFVMNSLFNFPP